jgi:MFS family permease
VQRAFAEDRPARSSVRPLRRVVSSLGVVASTPNLRRLELAFASAITSEWAFVVALGVFAYEHGGAANVGLLGLVRMVPAAFATPFIAAAADRYERERALASVVVLSGLAAAASAFLYYAGQNEAAIFAFASAHALISTLLRPAVAALLPSLAATPEQLVAANATTTTLEGFGMLVGPLLAGLLVATTDPGVVFSLGAVAYLAGALALATIRVEGRLRFARHRAGGGFAAGFGFLAREAQARLVVFLFAAQSAVRGALNVLITVIAFRLLDEGGGWVGFLSAAVGAGTLLGGLATVTFTGRRLGASFGFGLVLWGLPLALIAALADRPVVLLLLALVGVGNAIEDVSGDTLLQRFVSDDYLGRVLGVMYGATTAGMGVGAIVAPALIRAFGDRAAIAVIGLFLPALVLLFARRLAFVDAAAGERAKEHDLVNGVPMFEALPLPAKEHLARNLTPLRLKAGTAVVTEGEVGEHFYVVAAGTLDVTQAGRQIGSCAPGDYFGEIALLRNVPRTATVTARDDVELYSLDRASFIAAVTAQAAGRDAGERVVEARLARDAL